MNIVPTNVLYNSYLLRQNLILLNHVYPFLNIQVVGNSVLGKPIYVIAKTNSDISTTMANIATEIIFYDEPEDLWDQAMWRLAEVLEVISVEKQSVIINLTEVIERNLKALKDADLFICCTVNAIMSDMPAIISGYVSEEWFDEFTKCLK